MPSTYLRISESPPELQWVATRALTRLFPVTSTGVWTRWTELYFTSCCHLKSRVYIVDLYKSDILRPAYPSMTGGIIIVWGLRTQARKRLPLASCPSKGEPIRHFHISPKHLICPLKFCKTFVFHFSWVLQPSQEKLKAMLAYTKFWEANMVHYGKCGSGVWSNQILTDVKSIKMQPTWVLAFVSPLWFDKEHNSINLLVFWRVTRSYLHHFLFLSLPFSRHFGPLGPVQNWL